MSKPTPKVSIGLPVYNGQQYLAATIESLLVQTFGDFELIISDNASTDGTEAICRSYAARDERIRYFRQSANRGAPWNLAEVFRHARGEYFKWQAADDLCGPTLLECCVDVLDSDASVVIAYPRTAVIDQNGDIVPAAPGSWNAAESLLRHLDSKNPAHRVRDILMHTVWCHELFGLIRRDRMAETALHRDRSSGGKPFLVEMALKGRFHEVPEVLFFSRRHAAQYTMLTSAAAQRRFDQPDKKQAWFSLPHQIGCTWDFATCIARAPISLFARAACFGILLRYTLQLKKLQRIVRNSVRGFGMWDGSLSLPETRKPAERTSNSDNSASASGKSLLTVPCCGQAAQAEEVFS